jgi:hypothetical protein
MLNQIQTSFVQKIDQKFKPKTNHIKDKEQKYQRKKKTDRS